MLLSACHTSAYLMHGTDAAVSTHTHTFHTQIHFATTIYLLIESKVKDTSTMDIAKYETTYKTIFILQDQQWSFQKHKCLPDVFSLHQYSLMDQWGYIKKFKNNNR